MIENGSHLFNKHITKGFFALKKIKTSGISLLQDCVGVAEIIVEHKENGYVSFSVPQVKIDACL